MCDDKTPREITNASYAMPTDEEITEKTDSGLIHLYTFDDETKIVNYIMLADEYNVVKTIKNVFVKIGKLSAEPEVYKYISANIIRTFLRAISNIKTKDKELECDLINLLEIVKIDDTKRAEEGLIEKAKNICCEIRTGISPITKSISKKVEAFVNENYKDINLDVSRVSDFLNLSPSYATKVFKEETGEGLSYYINKIRVMKAKELLGLDMYRIEHIAEMVGYPNSRALSRSFKRIEGITPSQYRDILTIISDNLPF